MRRYRRAVVLLAAARPHGVCAQVKRIGQPVGRNLLRLGQTGLDAAVGHLGKQPFKRVGNNHAGGRIGCKLRVKITNAARYIVSHRVPRAIAAGEQDGQGQKKDRKTYLLHGAPPLRKSVIL